MYRFNSSCGMFWRWLKDGAEEWSFPDGEIFGVVSAKTIKEWYPKAKFVKGVWVV